MANRKGLKQRLKKKKKSMSTGNIDSTSSGLQMNEKMKLKKKRRSMNIFKKLADSLNLTKKKMTTPDDLDNFDSSSFSSSVSVNQKDDMSGSQSISMQETSFSDVSGSSQKMNTNNISIVQKEKNKGCSETYLVGNESEYRKQMRAYIINLGNCSCELLAQDRWFSMLAKLFIILEKHFSLGTIYNFDSAFSKLFPVKTIQTIVHKVATILKNEPILLELSAAQQDIVVVSDIHGSILDFIKVLSDNGLPGPKSYLFLGDYVDKGTEEVVVVTLVLLLKICYPKNVYLLRGNHEFLDQNSKNCFPVRCKHMFGSFNVYRIFNYSFEFLPLAAIVDNDILCVHGGISQWLTSRNSISSLLRPLSKNKDIISRMIITDLVWADTFRGEYETSNDSGFTISKRGIGFAFNEYGLKKILENLKVTRLIRGHQPYEEGYKVEYNNLCYTIHLRNLFEYYNSHGSYCILKNLFDNEPLTKPSIYIDLKKYSLTTQIPTPATAAALCRNLIHEAKKTLEILKPKELSKDEKSCPHCSDKLFYLKCLVTKKRTFVIHDQIKELIINDRQSKTKNKNYQIFQTYLKNDNHIPIERFPIFLDLIYNKQVRDPQLISSEDKELINKVKKDLKMVHNDLNLNVFFGYSNLPFQYYNSNCDIDKDNALRCEIRLQDLFFKKMKPFINEGHNDDNSN